MIFDLGSIDYEKCYDIQRTLVRRRRSGEIGDSAIIAEHGEIFTIGRTGSEGNVLVSPEALSRGGIKVLRVDRGGDVTFHGPGQLVIYPIIDLRKSDKDLHRYLRDLEELAICFLRDYSVFGARLAGKTGVWTAGEKIASIGIGASGWVTYHGLSININCDLKFFSMINPCGMADAKMTSVEKVAGRKIEMDEAKAKVVRCLKNLFGIGYAGDRNKTSAVA